MYAAADRGRREAAFGDRRARVRLVVAGTALAALYAATAALAARGLL